jgi:hypothetical protein
MGKCELGECPQSKIELQICCLDCKTLETCLEKNYTCLQVLRIRAKIATGCENYLKEGRIKMSNKKEISIDRVKQITQEELHKYINGNFSEESLRKTIQEQLDKSGKNIVFKELGLKLNSWGNGWEVNNYGAITNMIQNNPHIKNIGKEVIQKIIKEVTPEDVLVSLNKTNIQSLRKVYRETLMKYFEEEVRNLAKIHGKDNAERLFKKYLYEKVELNEEETSNKI